VARRLGVAPATLRSWSARYGIGPLDHRAGRYRRYSSTDVAELDTLSRLRRQGVPMATAASLARDRRLHGPPDGAGTGGDGAGGYWADAVVALERAARDLDADAAVGVLDAAFAGAGIVATWDRLCRPVLATISLATADGGPLAPDGSGRDPVDAGADPAAQCIDAECVLTWAITTSLRRRPPGPAVPGARRVLLACATGELHTLALDALFAALDEQQIPARMLGPSVPAPALLHATTRIRPAAVFVWAQTARTASPAVLRGLGRHADAVVAAGPGWDPATLPRRVLTVAGLRDAVDRARRTAG
jgi:DNA-binding transcriptional MerR regulator